MFNRDFMDYHQDRFEDYSLLVFKNKELVAILPANIYKGVLHSHQGLSYGGLVLNAKSKLPEVIECYKHVLKFLNEQSIKSLHIKLLPTIYHSLPSDEIDYILFKTKAKKIRCDIASVIENSNIIHINSSNRKRGFSRAKIHNLVVKETDDFQQFWNGILMPNLNKRYNVNPVHSLEEITKLKTNFPKNIRQFNVFYNDELVAGVTIFETNTVAHAQYISANDKKQELGSLDALFYYLISKVFFNKKYFDFGISNENEGKNINEGLLYWKESFGARSISHEFYEIETINHNLLDSVFI